MSKQTILSLASRATWAHKASLIATIQLYSSQPGRLGR